jgi:CheY-like chemotaxis protein
MKPSYTILYIDDDRDDLQMIAEAFLNFTEKLRVVHAHNGLEGLQVLDQMKAEGSLPCLIIMDINMPVLNGLDTLRRIRTIGAFKNLPVVLFSTSSNARDKEFARKWEADYITKPSKFCDLQGLVKEFVSRCVFETEKQA